MNNKLWFKAKRYGYGWYPATWQGWAIITAFVFIEILNFIRLDEVSHSNSDTLRPFIIQTAILTAVLIWICQKTGEKARWRWGDKDADK